MRRLLPLALAITLSACGTLQNGRGWGEDATLRPGGARVAWAANRAARDPGTWIPALSGVILHASGADERLSDWARDERPLFGDTADTTSDQLRDVTDLGFLVTALAAPSGPPEDVVEHKSRGLGVEVLAVLTTIGATNFLKDSVRREQPNGGHESFVSNHATEPFAHAALVRRNSDHLGLTPRREAVLDGTFYGLAGATAWARVEMGLHYPSDQLAGAAIGNFIALFVHDAFLGLDGDKRWSVTAAPGPTSTLVWGFRW